MKKLKVLGVCAGNGVCLFPFHKRKSFKVIGNIEPRGVFYDKKQEQWNANFEGIPQVKTSTSMKFKPDIIIGHPDCGDSSILRMSRAKKRGDARTNHSILTFLNCISKYKPKYWLMENLPGFLDVFSEADLKELMPDYNIKIWIDSVSYWGNSQVTRKRLVIVGSLNTLAEIPELSLNQSSTLLPSESFELGEEQPSIAHVREPLDKICNLYLPEQGLRQISYSHAKEVWMTKLKNQGRWPVGGKMKNQPGVSRNLKGAYPTTVRKQNRQFGTQGLVLSPREMANIQGVPLKFRLIFNNSQRIYWINKGRLTVTKTMPYEIANWFKQLVIKSIRRDWSHNQI